MAMFNAGADSSNLINATASLKTRLTGFLKITSSNLLTTAHTLPSSFKLDRNDGSGVFSASENQIILFDYETNRTKACVIYWDGATLTSALTTVSLADNVVIRRWRQNPTNTRQFVGIGTDNNLYTLTITANSTSITVTTVTPTTAPDSSASRLSDIVFNSLGTAYVLCSYSQLELYLISGTTSTKVAASEVALAETLTQWSTFFTQTISCASRLNDSTNESVFAVWGTALSTYSNIQAVRFTFTTSAITVTENENQIPAPLASTTYAPNLTTSSLSRSKVTVFGGVFSFMGIVTVSGSGWYSLVGTCFNSNTSFSEAGGGSYSIANGDGTTSRGISSDMIEYAFFPLGQNLDTITVSAYVRNNGSGFGSDDNNTDTAGILIEVNGNWIAGPSLFTPSNSAEPSGCVTTDASIYFHIQDGVARAYSVPTS